MTHIQDAENCLHIMLDILSYIPTLDIDMPFMNTPMTLRLCCPGEKNPRGHRAHSERNSLTCITCTNVDSKCAFMKEVGGVVCAVLVLTEISLSHLTGPIGEVAPFTAEVDEKVEVRSLHEGSALSRLVSNLVEAICPHGFVALDEAVSFTKYTLDKVLGHSNSASILTRSTMSTAMSSS